MSNYRDLTNRVSTVTIDAEIAALNAALDTKSDEVDAAIAAIPDVYSIAEENAIIMSIALG